MAGQKRFQTMNLTREVVEEDEEAFGSVGEGNQK